MYSASGRRSEIPLKTEIKTRVRKGQKAGAQENAGPSNRLANLVGLLQGLRESGGAKLENRTEHAEGFLKL